jgi:SAM-dependent methyltransferase
LVDERNSTGRPLASGAWLEAHHRAKRLERNQFAELLATYEPTSVVDIGCATGLWLDLLDKVLPPACDFIGLDSDESALAEAKDRSTHWARRATFEQMDVEADFDAIPSADMTLFFNVFSYLRDPADLLRALGGRSNHGVVVVRQYDGAALRFGPMEMDVRLLVESSLRASVTSSEQLRHYDMDRVFSLLDESPFPQRRIEFELFARTTPFPQEFLDYFEGTLNWTQRHLSEDAANELRRWRRQLVEGPASQAYFYEVDLTAVLSWS